MKSQDMFGIDILKHGIQMYPDNLHYYHLIADLLGNKMDYTAGLHYAEKGLEKFPDDVGLLYTKAVHLRLLSSKDVAGRKKAIDAFSTFLQLERIHEIPRHVRH